MLTDLRDVKGEIEELKDPGSFCLSRSNTSDSLNSLSSITSSTASTARAKSYFCDYDGCNKAFTRPSLLTEHQEVVHQGKKRYICDECHRSFSKKSHLERHVYVHSQDKPLHCSSCGKGFTTGQQLRRHEITHTKSFKCPYDECNESFYKHPQLRSHILAVHEKKLSCKICNKEFQRPYRLQNHMVKHHNPVLENPYQCSFASCAKSFKTWSQLQTHVKSDHPKLRCPVCEKPCVGESGLQMHMKVHDESLVTRNWKCQICDNMSFARKSSMLEHYAQEHIEEHAKLLVEQTRSVGIIDERDFDRATEISNQQVKRRKISEMGLLKSQAKLHQYFAEGKGGLHLLLNTVGRKLRCPYDKCYRTFKTEEKFQKHLDKHKIHQLKLKVLKEKMESSRNEASAGHREDEAFDDSQVANDEKNAKLTNS
ncbi:Pzf1p TDEL_0H00280 [Torulaspora delbrueckii]|uniref:C2H2-type domain-containing protein n=1 Tax=Torulaspora delbrueckii TaxID=4950 RepID=G8ZZ43_TORDE|nr:hypothetical protein TDEL_0H00280 [Torulaspora delbrueckii]CCE93887.1 hypothetical protein TDEL_0H00280 [Torulaspora delbrueckii]